MDAQVFIATRPCIEEIKGWLLGRKIQGLPVTDEVLAPVEAYEERLMSGKEVPAPSKLEREWVYQQGRKPVFKPRKGPMESEHANKDSESAPRKQPKKSNRPTLHYSKGRKRGTQTVRLCSEW